MMIWNGKTQKEVLLRTKRFFELLEARGESGNITKAADKLFITQSALSKGIKSIERELGVELLKKYR